MSRRGEPSRAVSRAPTLTRSAATTRSPVTAQARVRVVPPSM